MNCAPFDVELGCMKRPQKGESNILLFFLALILIALTGLTVYFWQNYEKEKAINALKKSISAVDISTKIIETKRAPVVVYIPNGLFTEDEIVEINKKFVKPFIDWNSDNNQNSVSISVEKPYTAITGYQYKVTYINEGGGNGGFLYGTTTPLEWWLPECLDSCSFSAEFEAKYPDIVAKMAL